MEKMPKQMTLLEFEAALDARLRHASLVRAMSKVEPDTILSKSPERPDMKSAVLGVIKSQPMRAEDVAFALMAKGIVIKNATLLVLLSRLASDGLIVRMDRGLYCHINGAVPLKVDSQENVAERTAAMTSKSISQQVMEFLTAAEKPVSANEISRDLIGVTPAYASALLNQLLRAGKVTHEKGLWCKA